MTRTSNAAVFGIALARQRRFLASLARTCSVSLASAATPGILELFLDIAPGESVYVNVVSDCRLALVLTDGRVIPLEILAISDCAGTPLVITVRSPRQSFAAGPMFTVEAAIIATENGGMRRLTNKTFVPRSGSVSSD